MILWFEDKKEGDAKRIPGLGKASKNRFLIVLITYWVLRHYI